MIRVRVAHVRPDDSVAAIALESALDVGRTEAPQRLASHHAEQQIVPAGRVLRTARLAGAPAISHVVLLVVRLEIGQTTTDDDAIHLC